VPLRLVVPPSVPIELWDSGVAVSAHAGDTLQTIATTYHVPLWALTQINKVSDAAALTEGQRIVVPRYLGQKLPSPAPAAAPAAAQAPAAPAGETPAGH
jgi:LysM repeat protein